MDSLFFVVISSLKCIIRIKNDVLTVWDLYKRGIKGTVKKEIQLTLKEIKGKYREQK